MGSRVYFGRLARDCRERDVEKLLRNYGEVREIHLRSGYGFVEFRDHRDAEDAIYDLHGREFLGERLIVEHARSTGRSSTRDTRPPPPVHTSNRVIVENIPSHASWQDLKDFMKKAGEVAFADCHKDRLGEGVVEFYSSSDMRYALERLDDAEFRGQRIRLIKDPSASRSSRRRDRTRSHSYSRSPRRSSRRSPSRSASPAREKSRYSRSPRRGRSRSASRSPRGHRSRSRSNGARREDSRSPHPSKDIDGSRSPSPAPRDRSLTPQDNE